MKNKMEINNLGIENLFPNVIDKQKVNELKYRQIQRVLTEVLDDNQRSILERKYLGNRPINDIEIYLDMGLSKEQFYIQKKQAIRLFATAAGII